MKFRQFNFCIPLTTPQSVDKNNEATLFQHYFHFVKKCLNCISFNFETYRHSRILKMWQFLNFSIFQYLMLKQQKIHNSEVQKVIYCRIMNRNMCYYLIKKLQGVVSCYQMGTVHELPNLLNFYRLDLETYQPNMYMTIK